MKYNFVFNGIKMIDEKDVKSFVKENEYGEKLYKVYVNSGLCEPYVFVVYAYDEQGAIDSVADVCMDEGIVLDYDAISELCDNGQSVDEYIEDNNLICCGNNCVYLEVVGISDMSTEEA